MLSVLTQVVYVALIPAGLVLASTPERLALLAVAAVLLLRVLARHHAGARQPGVPTPELSLPPLDRPTGRAAGAQVGAEGA
jgi:hypothetical protein